MYRMSACIQVWPGIQPFLTIVTWFQTVKKQIKKPDNFILHAVVKLLTAHSDGEVGSTQLSMHLAVGPVLGEL